MGGPAEKGAARARAITRARGEPFKPQVYARPSRLEFDSHRYRSLKRRNTSCAARCSSRLAAAPWWCARVPALLGETNVQGLVRDLADEFAELARARAQGVARRGVRHARLPRQRPRRPPLEPSRDGRALAANGSDPPQRPMQPRPAHLRRIAPRRYRAALRAAVIFTRETLRQ